MTAEQYERLILGKKNDNKNKNKQEKNSFLEFVNKYVKESKPVMGLDRYY